MTNAGRSCSNVEAEFWSYLGPAMKSCNPQHVSEQQARHVLPLCHFLTGWLVLHNYTTFKMISVTFVKRLYSNVSGSSCSWWVHVQHMQLQLWNRCCWPRLLLTHVLINGDGAICSSNIHYWVSGLWCSNLFFTSILQKGRKKTTLTSHPTSFEGFCDLSFFPDGPSGWISSWGFIISCEHNY